MESDSPHNRFVSPDSAPIPAGGPEPEAPGSDIVRSPTTTGGIVFRYFVGDGTHEAEIESSRREIRLARLGQGDRAE